MGPVLIITPPGIGQVLPRGALEIASTLSSQGAPVELLLLAHELGAKSGATLGDESRVSMLLADSLAALNPLAVGVSNQFTQHLPQCLRILQLCKELQPEIPTIIGGPHVSFEDDSTLGAAEVDIVVRGEGEWTMLALQQALADGAALDTVSGITFRRANGELQRNPDREPGDLSQLAPLDYGLLPADFVRQADIFGMLNRGCRYRCRFCAEAAFWRTRRSFTVARLVAEMETLARDHGTKLTAIEDSMMYLGSEQQLELCAAMQLADVRLSQRGYIQSRVDTVDSDGLEAALEADISHVWLGIESASPAVLEKMNKRTTPAQARQACTTLRAAGMNNASYWIVGHPGDTPTEASRSLAFAEELFQADLMQQAELALFIPYPGTPYFRDPAHHGIEVLDWDFAAWERWCPRPIAELETFPAEQLTETYERWEALLRRQGRLSAMLAHGK